MELIDRLKIRLGITEDEDILLSELLLSAKEIFLSLRYPSTPIPIDENDAPIIEPRWDGWILAAAIELYSKTGAEGQISHHENGIIRGYEAGDISTSLRSRITPKAGVISANS